jgi:hypothetical protein
LTVLTVDRSAGERPVDGLDLILGWGSVACFFVAARGLERHQLWALAPAAATLAIQMANWHRHGAENALSLPRFLWLAFLLTHRTSRAQYRRWVQQDRLPA